MPFSLKPVAELEQQFTITSVAGIDEVTEDDPISVVFRQATEYEDRKRASRIIVPVTRIWRDGQDMADEQITYKPDAETRAVEVFLTMASCDIEDSNGNPLFSFTTNGKSGRQSIIGAYEKFEARWGLLPSPVALAIHTRCLEANPHWSPRYTSVDQQGE